MFLSGSICPVKAGTKLACYFSEAYRGYDVTLSAGALLIAGLFVGWGIGANDAANSMGMAVGAGVRSVKQAMLLVAGCGLAGALLLGARVIQTVGYGVFPIGQVEPVYRDLFVLAVSIAAGITVTASTWLKAPTSTSHAIVGVLSGAGLPWAGRTWPIGQ